MNKLSVLEQEFQKAACDLTAPAGSEIKCGCGRTHRQEGDDPLKYGAFSGYTLVLGCTCPAASSFAGMAWSERHALARFLRGMSDALEADLVRLRGELPPDLGRKESDSE